MGIQRSEGNGGAVFLRLNAKTGTIHHDKLDAEGKVMKDADGKRIPVHEAPGSRLVGTIVGIKIVEDEYQGAKNYKVRLSMVDPEPGQPRMIVDFPFGSDANGASFFGLQLMGKLNSCDLAKPVALMPWKLEAGTGTPPLATDRTGVTVYQDGEKIKENFGTADAPEERLPERRKIVVRGKEQNDPSDTSWDDKAQQVFRGLVQKLSVSAAEAESAGAPAEEEVDVGEALAGAEGAAAAAAPARPRFAGA